MRLINITICAFAAITSSALAGPIAWGLCQSACNAGYVACCASAGGLAAALCFGFGLPAALVACSGVQSACMVACTPLLLAPTP